MKELIQKYLQAGPRYTSYPPVPFWQDQVAEEQWKASLFNNVLNEKDNGVSIYIHLPYCESLCTYCGCNTRITTNHSVEKPYIEAVLKEWCLYRSGLPADMKISEMHIGGGTPTFFSASNLYYLISNILKDCAVSDKPEFSIEGHPNSTSEEQLRILRLLGFKRISYGIQDFNAVVQKAIHRFQSFAQVEKITRISRECGFDSVNYDLIYGLPFQTVDSIKETFEQVLQLRPDRIAFYGYAHVPWIKPGQRSYEHSDLPLPEERLNMYETGRKILEDAGYYEIGMDHFALKSDSLYKSLMAGKLNRNFMGYTDSTSKIIIALGVSSISDDGDMYAQNVKTVEEYFDLLKLNKLPVMRGHVMSDENKRVGKHIKQLMCHFRTTFHDNEDDLFETSKPALLEMAKDGILSLNDKTIQITNTGRRFVRNICMAIDPLLKEKQEGVFSSTV
jgi:oxygen-independent coproporphyrinogen-3 oxidase